ncbi:MAG: hypothetical protein Q8Q23_02940 [bacterium]|nr:hypothetical protein [bacterium]
MIITFLSIALGGFVVLMFTLAFGGDHDVDHDFDHDFDSDGDHGSIGAHWFSVKVLSAFATAFGATGVITCVYNFSDFWKLVISTGVGIVIAAIVDAAVSMLYKQQTTTIIRTNECVGKTGTVTLGILANGTGEVRIELEGMAINKPARSQSGEEIKQGEEVEVLSGGSPLIVKKS